MRIAETLLFVGTVGCAAVAEVIAQAAPAPPGGLPDIDVGNLTATGILGWYAWHTASRTIPGLVKDFREESREQREAFKEEMRTERENHRAELLDLRHGLAHACPLPQPAEDE